MLSASDLGGLMAMMPAFAADDAADIRATSTIDVGRLHHGLDRMIGDGANVIATTGSFGECHTLLPEEFRTLAHECVAVVKKRVPLFIGITSVNSREAVAKLRMIENSGADGVLAGVPYYFPSSVENAVRFYRDIGEMFPKLNIMIYHNPALHHVTIPVEAFHELTKNRAVIAMKDSHRTPEEFVALQKIIRGKMGVFVHQGQYITYAPLGAAGLWSIDAWMGPWPQLALRDAVKRGDTEAAKAITLDIAPPGQPPASLSWRETAAKVAIRIAGYVDPGPLRPPFVEIPPEVTERMTQRVERWKKICEKYRTLVPAE
ncbi:MAG: hydratase-aldolase [Alphaproteobacteria bacterium]|nr:hydratase-aldolase [Alphaproteobacteria bacterium]